MMEKLPLVMLAEMIHYDGYYVIPKNCPFAGQSIELLGVDPERIIEHDGTNWLIEILCLPQNIDQSDQDVFIMLRKRLLESTKHLADHRSPRRIYISRKSALSKRIANEDDLVATIKPYGFVTCAMEDLHLKKQIALMAAADALITPHGAGMVHTLFMQPQSLVLELFSPTYINPCMLPAIDFLRHRYYMIPSYFNYPNHYSDKDIEAFIRVIEITLRRDLSPS
jgi:capsular polysaccharide biosynthesis protein